MGGPMWCLLKKSVGQDCNTAFNFLGATIYTFYSAEPAKETKRYSTLFGQLSLYIEVLIKTSALLAFQNCHGLGYVNIGNDYIAIYSSVITCPICIRKKRFSSPLELETSFQYGCVRLTFRSAV